MGKLGTRMIHNFFHAWGWCVIFLSASVSCLENIGQLHSLVAKGNDLRNPILLNQTISKENVYQVVSGDTLNSISVRKSVPVAYLRDWNQLDNQLNGSSMLPGGIMLYLTSEGGSA